MTMLRQLTRPLFDYGAFMWLFAAALVGETLLNLAIVARIPYTEIDWIAYMQEVAGPIEQGQWDYSQLAGQTVVADEVEGPLVYPAGFVWIYSILYWATERGTDILTAQLLFVGLHVFFVAVVMLLYREAGPRIGMPPWALLLLCMSRRIHSIFVLRLFNDCWAMLFVYLGILLLCRRKWVWTSVLLTCAVSVKMNVLLFLPAYMVLLVKGLGMIKAVGHVTLMTILQALIGLPFLLQFPWEYLRGSFNFSRKFFYIWTVNWKFLDEEQFLSDTLSDGLLIATLATLFVFAATKWCSTEGGPFAAVFGRHALNGYPTISASHAVCLLFTSNFVGIMFARSLHFQFYVWYYHTLPALLWLTPYPTPIRLLLLGATEVVWNVFPSVAWSSALLQSVNVIILFGLLQGKVPHPQPAGKHKYD